MEATTLQTKNLMDLIVTLGHDLNPITIGTLKQLEEATKDKPTAEVVSIINQKLAPQNALKSFLVVYENQASVSHGKTFLVREVPELEHHFLQSDGGSHVGGGKLLKKYCRKL